MFNPTQIVIEAFVGELRTMYERTYGTLEPSHPGIIGFVARLALENIATSDAAYHDVNHTIMVTLVGQEILRGRVLPIACATAAGGASPAIASTAPERRKSARSPNTTWRISRKSSPKGDLAVARIARTAPPAIAELWELIPAQTRTSVETKVRRWKAPKRGQVVAFLKRLVGLLQDHPPTVQIRLPLAIERRYIQNAAELWRSFGLNVGRAHDGARSGSVESPFQRFARLALSAVGDNSGISDRQIANLKSDRRRRCDR